MIYSVQAVNHKAYSIIQSKSKRTMVKTGIPKHMSQEALKSKAEEGAGCPSLEEESK